MMEGKEFSFVSPPQIYKFKAEDSIGNVETIIKDLLNDQENDTGEW
jgi:hypothetical protein